MNGQSRCWFLNCLYLEYIAYIKDLIERKKKQKTSITKKGKQNYKVSRIYSEL